MLKNVSTVGLLILIGFFGQSSKAQTLSAQPSASIDVVQQKHWVDSVYESLSWNERIGQLFMIPAHSSKNTDHRKDLQHLIKSSKVGGVLFMQGSPHRQAQLTNQLQSVSGIPLLIGMDLTFGLGTHLDSTLRYPRNLTLRAVSDSALISQIKTDIAQQINTMGIHLNLSMMDDSNTQNQVIHTQFLNENRRKGVLSLEENNLFLFSENVPLAIKNMRKAMRKLKVKKEYVEKRVKHILTTKHKKGLYDYKPINLNNLGLKLHQPEFSVTLHKLYQSAITVINNENNLLPFHIIDTTTFASLSLNDLAPTFHQSLIKYSKINTFSRDTTKSVDKIINKLKNYEVVIVGVFGMNSSSEENHGIKKEDIELIETISKHSKVIVAVFGSPHSLPYFEKFDHVVYAYENNHYTQSLVPQALFGAISTDSKLPISANSDFAKKIGLPTKSLQRLGVSIPEMVGMDSQVLNKIDLIAQEAIESMATPGCQVLVARNGKIVFEKSYGYHTYDSARAVSSESIYDLASITKVAASLQAVAFMEEQGLIDLDKKISYYLTDLKGSNKEDMTIRDILTHQSGLWPYLPFWKQTMSNEDHLPQYYNHESQPEFPYFVSKGLYTSKNIRESVWQWVVESKVRSKKKNVPYRYKYSDMGYYMMHRLAEQVLNQPMEDFLAQNIYEPLGLSTLGYNPLTRFSENRITPTELDSTFRMSQVWGTVHDQGAALFGGVAGHAGLFSNARDLAVLMQMHLQGGVYGGQRYFNKNTLDKFTKQQFDNYNRRGVGWDKPLPGAWYGPTSQYASNATFGHTGFTGTAVWADPTFDLVFVFLSNRIYPDAGNRKLIRNNIRTRIQDLVYQSIWEYSKYH